MEPEVLLRAFPDGGFEPLRVGPGQLAHPSLQVVALRLWESGVAYPVAGAEPRFPPWVQENHRSACPHREDAGPAHRRRRRSEELNEDAIAREVLVGDQGEHPPGPEALHRGPKRLPVVDDTGSEPLPGLPEVSVEERVSLPPDERVDRDPARPHAHRRHLPVPEVSGEEEHAPAPGDRVGDPVEALDPKACLPFLGGHPREPEGGDDFPAEVPVGAEGDGAVPAGIPAGERPPQVLVDDIASDSQHGAREVPEPPRERRRESFRDPDQDAGECDDEEVLGAVPEGGGLHARARAVPGSSWSAWRYP